MWEMSTDKAREVDYIPGLCLVTRKDSRRRGTMELFEKIWKNAVCVKGQETMENQYSNSGTQLVRRTNMQNHSMIHIFKDRPIILNNYS